MHQTLVVVFSGCSSITEIPGGLFRNNINTTRFMECFKGCSSVTEIPEELFANNVDTAIFIGCFSECISFEKNSRRTV